MKVINDFYINKNFAQGSASKNQGGNFYDNQSQHERNERSQKHDGQYS